MTGPKLNEMSFVAGERSGTKATAKYVRTSASKARVVLDLIRGLDVKSADEVLQFTDRHVAQNVRKVLASAVANAVNNDEQDAEELYVIACFADEGPTLRRFRPRARGRASRILKRSCHITVIVARMSDERIEILTARQERAGGGGGGRGRPQSSSASRRARVERSRAKSADAEEASTDEAATDESAAEETTDDVATDAEIIETDAEETSDEATDAEHAVEADDEPATGEDNS
jgi:large subunit ribosomal protein L22